MSFSLLKFSNHRSALRRKFSSYFITTPIFYVNAKPHLGHLYTAVIADAAARFQLLQGKSNNDSLIFGTGTDEHGSKIQRAAEELNIPPEKYCLEISEKYKSLFNLFDVKYTHFIRTTDKKHKRAVQHFWNLLKDRGHITSGSYSGWYCPADEAFLSENEIKLLRSPDKSEIKVSIESGRPVEWAEEKNFRFNLGKFIPDVEHWLKTEQPIQPSKFCDIALQYISNMKNAEFAELSVSRPSNRVPWGIPVPEHPDQTVYVWLDALVNYLTIAGYPENLSQWPPNVQIIGKDILKFHGIYWPAFLIAAGLEPPQKIHVHSHWTVDDKKMSKSAGNVIDPFERADIFTASGLRYFLLRAGTAHSDANYSETKVLRMLNAELADSLGNLLSRCTGSAINLGQIFPAFSAPEFERLFCASENLKDLASRIENLQGEVEQHFENFDFYRGLEYIILTVHAINKFFEHSEPWKLKKDPEKLEDLLCVLHVTMESLKICAIALSPIIPQISSSLLDKLSVTSHERHWSNLVPSWKLKIPTRDRKLLDETILLYQRIK